MVTALLSWSGTTARVTPPMNENTRDTLDTKSMTCCVRVASA
jgi:hypothetical protein